MMDRLTLSHDDIERAIGEYVGRKRGLQGRYRFECEFFPGRNNLTAEVSYEMVASSQPLSP